MPKIFLATAAIVLTATSAAYATPRMGSLSAMADGGAPSQEASAKAEPTSFLAFLLRTFNIRLPSTEATAAPNDAAHQSGNANSQCKDSEKSKADEAADAKSSKSAGPDPVYLAF